MGRFGPDIGNVDAGPLRTIRPFGIPGAPRSEFECLVPGWNIRSRPYHFDDFLSSTLVLPNVLQDDSAVGAPTFAQRVDIANGVYRATLAATSEVENIGFDWGDQRMIAGNKAWLIEGMIALPAALAANEHFFFGLIDDFNADPDLITRSVWFRINGAATPNLTLIMEGDDATNDPSTATTFSLTAGTMALLRIDGADLNAVKFWVNDQYLGSISIPLLGAGMLQPVFILRKTTGTTVPTADIDYYYVESNRS